MIFCTANSFLPLPVCSLEGNSSFIKTHDHVSAAKKDVWHTSVLFTGTAKSPFSTPHISITTGLISI